MVNVIVGQTNSSRLFDFKLQTLLLMNKFLLIWRSETRRTCKIINVIASTDETSDDDDDDEDDEDDEEEDEDGESSEEENKNQKYIYWW